MRQRFKKAVRITGVSLAVFVISLCAAYMTLYIIAAYGTDRVVVAAETVPVVSDLAVPDEVATPTSLRIDSIGVGAIVKPVGLTADGDMDIDDNDQEVAWYQLGPKPGEKGSAVMAGHYGWKNAVPSVFNKLNELKPGDEVTSIGEDSQRLIFVVNRIATYDPQQDATDVFTSSDGKAHLNLITCQGSWDNEADTYTQRLVVFATLK